MVVSKTDRRILHVDFTELSSKTYENQEFWASAREAHFGPFLNNHIYKLLASPGNRFFLDMGAHANPQMVFQRRKQLIYMLAQKWFKKGFPGRCPIFLICVFFLTTVP